MKSVLLVDDDKVLLTILVNLLRSAGLDVHSATDVHQAIRLLKQQSFDLIATDANMPSLSGFDLLEIIKRNEAAYGFPQIIMLTGRSAKRDEDLAKLWGAKQFITKPVDPIYVMGLVFELLNVAPQSTAKKGVEVRETARWSGAFEIVQIHSDHIVFTCAIPIPAGCQIIVGSPLLNAISPACAHVEVTGCEVQEDGEGYKIKAKFSQCDEEDELLISEWIERERHAA